MTRRVWQAVGLCAGLSFGALEAYATPNLQIYLPGGTYDDNPDEESWVTSDNPTEVWIAGVAENDREFAIKDIRLYVAFSDPNATVNVTVVDIPGSTAGDTISPENAVPILGKPVGLDPHGIYDTYYFCFLMPADLDLVNGGDTVYDYPELDPNNPTGGKAGDIFKVSVEYLGDGSAHMDLTGTLYIQKRTGVDTRLVTAPYSHDGVQTPRNPPPPIPVPSALYGGLALISGMLGTKLRRSRKA